MKTISIDNGQANRLIGMKFMCEQSGLSKAYFYKLIAAGQFPKPLKFGRSSRWLYSDYLALLAERDAKRSAKAH